MKYFRAGSPATAGLLLLFAMLCAYEPAIAAEASTTESQWPKIDPDYLDATIPPNVAPLNFVILEPGEQFKVVVQGEAGEAVGIESKSGAIRFPIREWQVLLAENAGRDLLVKVVSYTGDGARNSFKPFQIHVSLDPIDPYILYRFTRPIFNDWRDMRIVQRHIEGFDETVIIDNADIDHGCFNCHTFSRNRPESMVIQVRSADYGIGMLLAQPDGVVQVDARTPFNKSPAAYSSWSPNGDLIACSVNKLSQFFHTQGENRDVFDAKSDIIVYRISTNEVTTSESIAHPDHNETFPCWAPDGRNLYFSSATPASIERHEDVRYDLVRAAYDPAADLWGEREVLLSGEALGRSILEAKVSPDNRFVLFSAADCGNFPVYKPSCDLYILDLTTGEERPLECNSDESDSYHAWSSNGRWIVFSSKRRDGAFARPHFSHMDEEGHASKAFVLPQEDPEFYRSCLRTFTAPEFTLGPVPFTSDEIAGAILDPGARLEATLDPRVKPSDSSDDEPTSPWTQGTAQ